VKAFAPGRVQKLIPLPAGFIKVSLHGFLTAILFYACSSVCWELSVKFVRFYKNAISRVFLGRNFKKPLAISVLKWYVVSNKSETWIHLLWSSNFGSAHAFVFHLAIFFIYLLIIYPACPARDEKSDDPPARVVAFSFARRGQSASRKSTALQMTCHNCFSLSRPKKFV
jgi:hypothetical protein